MEVRVVIGSRVWTRDERAWHTDVEGHRAEFIIAGPGNTAHTMLDVWENYEDEENRRQIVSIPIGSVRSHQFGYDLFENATNLLDVMTFGEVEEDEPKEETEEETEGAEG